MQPDLPLNSDGFYDALALRHAPSLADPFKVNVVWRGTGAPGPQPFTIYDTNFQPLVHGQTTGVPTFDFSTVSLAPLANTTVWGRIVDPGPDLLPGTADDSMPGPDGLPMTEDDLHLLPIAGVKVFLIGLEDPHRLHRCRRRGGGARDRDGGARDKRWPVRGRESGGR